jgi:hypothetical protein
MAPELHDNLRDSTPLHPNNKIQSAMAISTPSTSPTTMTMVAMN